MSLIDDNVLPREFLQMSLLPEDHLVACNAYIELFVNQSFIDQSMPIVFGTLQDQDVYLRSPPGEFSVPVVEGGLWNCDEMRTLDTADMAKISQEGNRLQGFAQTHLVRKDARDAIFVKGDEPVQASNLVVPHLTALYERWGFAEDRLSCCAMLVIPQKLSVFLLFGLPFRA